MHICPAIGKGGRDLKRRYTANPSQEGNESEEIWRRTKPRPTLKMAD